MKDLMYHLFTKQTHSNFSSGTHTPNNQAESSCYRWTTCEMLSLQSAVLHTFFYSLSLNVTLLQNSPANFATAFLHT